MFCYQISLYLMATASNHEHKQEALYNLFVLRESEERPQYL